jgi:outer membrane protein assembly factor BamB
VRLRLLLSPFLFLLVSADWPDFRGPAGDGHSSETNLPYTWSESENVAWKVELPGAGWSTPVISDGLIWLTTATEGNRSLRVLAVEAASGKIRVNTELFRLTQPVSGHSKNSGASPSAVVDGDRVYLHFGTYGTACVRKDGSILWRNQELKFFQVHGPGGSPALYGALLIINCDGNDSQSVVALDKMTGRIVWRKPRPSAMAYSTPLIIRTGSGPQAVSTGAQRAVSYNPVTGEEIWSVRYGDGFSNVPRPVYAHGLVYLCTGFYQPNLLAVRVDGRGDVTSTHIVWRNARGVPLTPSPIVVGEQIYMISDNGILTAMNARTGQEYWRHRLSSAYSASPLAADGRIYFLSEEGDTTVIAQGEQFRKLTVNRLDGRFLASIAVSDGALFLRSEQHLYRIGKKNAE